MSTAPEPPPFHRPRWVIPVAVVGAVLVVLGLALGIGLSAGGDDDKPITVTSTTVG
jgi:hypothetical protein